MEIIGLYRGERVISTGLFDDEDYVPRKLPRLRGLSPFEFNPEEVAGWPAESRAQITAIKLTQGPIARYHPDLSLTFDLGDESSRPYGFIRMLDALPSLRRVHWTCGMGDDAALERVVSKMKQHGRIEFLYMSCDSLYIEDLSCLAPLRDQLKELVIIPNSCDFELPMASYEDYWELAVALERHVLPNTSTRIVDIDDLGAPERLDSQDFGSDAERLAWCEDFTSPLDRHFLPDLVERWTCQI